MRWRRSLFLAVTTPVAGLLFLWYAATGLRSGVVEQVYRGGGGVVHRATQPEFYWLTEGFQLVMVCVSLAAAVFSAGDAWRHAPATRARKKAALDQEAAAQVRNREVGEGPKAV